MMIRNQNTDLNEMRKTKRDEKHMRRLQDGLTCWRKTSNSKTNAAPTGGGREARRYSQGTGARQVSAR